MNPSLEVTVVIKTRCRKSLSDAVRSAIREEFPVMVASDGFSFSEDLNELLSHPLVSNCCLGRHYGQYGAMAFNVGALLATTPFVAMLDDDDEFIVGARKLICDKLASDPSVDVWIPGLKYSNGHVICIRPNKLHVTAGNVACPILRTDTMTTTPLLHVKKTPGYQDFYHIARCQDAGYKVDWIGKPCILVRPKLPGNLGGGK